MSHFELLFNETILHQWFWQHSKPGKPLNPDTGDILTWKEPQLTSHEFVDVVAVIAKRVNENVGDNTHELRIHRIYGPRPGYKGVPDHGWQDYRDMDDAKKLVRLRELHEKYKHAALVISGGKS